MGGGISYLDSDIVGPRYGISDGTVNISSHAYLGRSDITGRVLHENPWDNDSLLRFFIMIGSDLMKAKRNEAICNELGIRSVKDLYICIIDNESILSILDLSAYDINTILKLLEHPQNSIDMTDRWGSQSESYKAHYQEPHYDPSSCYENHYLAVFEKRINDALHRHVQQSDRSKENRDILNSVAQYEHDQGIHRDYAEIFPNTTSNDLQRSINNLSEAERYYRALVHDTVDLLSGSTSTEGDLDTYLPLNISENQQDCQMNEEYMSSYPQVRSRVDEATSSSFRRSYSSDLATDRGDDNIPDPVNNIGNSSSQIEEITAWNPDKLFYLSNLLHMSDGFKRLSSASSPDIITNAFLQITSKLALISIKLDRNSLNISQENFFHEIVLGIITDKVLLQETSSNDVVGGYTYVNDRFTSFRAAPLIWDRYESKSIRFMCDSIRLNQSVNVWSEERLIQSVSCQDICDQVDIAMIIDMSTCTGAFLWNGSPACLFKIPSNMSLLGISLSAGLSVTLSSDLERLLDTWAFFLVPTGLIPDHDMESHDLEMAEEFQNGDNQNPIRDLNDEDESHRIHRSLSDDVSTADDGRIPMEFDPRNAGYADQRQVSLSNSINRTVPTIFEPSVLPSIETQRSRSRRGYGPSHDYPMEDDTSHGPIIYEDNSRAHSFLRRSSQTREETKCKEKAEDMQSSENASMNCCICLQRLKCVLLLPCLHLCLCEVCADKDVTGNIPDCPICRQSIQHRLRVYV